MKKRGTNIYWAPTVCQVCDKSLTSNILLFSQSIKNLTVIIIPTLWMKKCLLDLNWPWKTDWFKTGKGVSQVCILVTAYWTYLQSTLCEMPGWMNHKVESRLPGEISTTSDILHMIPPDGRKPRGTEEPLDENERGGLKAGLNSTFKKLRLWHPVPQVHSK